MNLYMMFTESQCQKNEDDATSSEIQYVSIWQKYT